MKMVATDFDEVKSTKNVPQTAIEWRYPNAVVSFNRTHIDVIIDLVILLRDIINGVLEN